MALSANTPSALSEITGKYGQHPAAASATIYEGSMCGAASGYARALTAGDLFLGHAMEKVDNSAGSAGDKTVKLLTGIYRLQSTLASVAITDIGKDVYASDDGTLTLTKGSNSRVGRVHRYVAANTCVVEFHAQQGSDLPDHNHTAGTDGGALTSPVIKTRIVLASSSAGINIGSVNTQKIGLYDVTPVAQYSAIADPTGSTAASLRAVQVKVLAALRAIGVIDT